MFPSYGVEVKVMALLNYGIQVRPPRRIEVITQNLNIQVRHTANELIIGAAFRDVNDIIQSMSHIPESKKPTIRIWPVTQIRIQRFLEYIS